MNTRIGAARDLAKEAPHSLSERVARFAIAINGCSAPGVSKSHWEQAKRELTSGPDTDRKAAVFESAPESERWDPVPGSTGHKVPAAPSEDEDEDGRSDNARLVEEGVAEAEHDHIVQAARAADMQDGG